MGTAMPSSLKRTVVGSSHSVSGCQRPLCVNLGTRIQARRGALLTMTQASCPFRGTPNSPIERDAGGPVTTRTTCRRVSPRTPRRGATQGGCLDKTRRPAQGVLRARTPWQGGVFRQQNVTPTLALSREQEHTSRRGDVPAYRTIHRQGGYPCIEMTPSPGAMCRSTGCDVHPGSPNVARVKHRQGAGCGGC